MQDRYPPLLDGEAHRPDAAVTCHSVWQIEAERGAADGVEGVDERVLATR
jgi:hypothetical protein